MPTRWLAAADGSLTLGSSAQAVAYKVSMDTSGLSGTIAQLTFDLIDEGSPSNSVTIGDLATDVLWVCLSASAAWQVRSPAQSPSPTRPSSASCSRTNRRSEV